MVRLHLFIQKRQREVGAGREWGGGGGQVEDKIQTRMRLEEGMDGGVDGGRDGGRDEGTGLCWRSL